MGLNHSQEYYSFNDGVKKLLDGKTDDEATWELLFSPRLNALELDVRLPSLEIRKLRVSRPDLFACLIYKAVATVDKLGDGTRAATAQEATRATTALLVLGRVLPFAFEPMPKVELPENASPHPLAPRFAELLFEHSADFSDSDGRSQFAPIVRGEPFGVTAVRTIVRAGVIPGFTTAPFQTKEMKHPQLPNVDAGRLWMRGIASLTNSPRAPDSDQYHVPRLAVVRAVVGLMSGQLFDERILRRDFVRRALVSTETPFASTLVVSLINTIVTYEPTGSLPYTSNWVTKREQLVARCAEAVLLLLDFTDLYPPEMIDGARLKNLASGVAPTEPSAADQLQRDEAASPAAEAPAEEDAASAFDGAVADDGPRDQAPVTAQRDGDEAAEGARSTDLGSPAGDSNQPAPFRVDLTKHAAWDVILRLSRTEALAMIRGVINLMSNYVACRNVYLPGSQRQVPGIELYFALFGMLIEKCEFLRTILGRSRVTARATIVPLLAFAFDGLESEARSARAICAVDTLMNLTSVRDVITGLNYPFNEWVPFPLDVTGATYADFVVLSLHSFIVKKAPWAQPLHDAMLRIVARVTPLMTSIAPPTAGKLVGLVKTASRPEWLQANAANASLLQHAVHALSLAIHHQQAASVHVIYALLRERAAVTQLVEVARQGEAVGLPKDYHKSLDVFTLHRAVVAADDELALGRLDDTQSDSLEVLKRVTLVGKLPPAPAFVPQFVEPQTARDAWRMSWTWAILYCHRFPAIIEPDAIRVFSAGKR